MELPVVTLRQIYVLCAVTQDLLPRIKCPTLLMHSRGPHQQPEQRRAHVQQIGTSRVELVWLENSTTWRRSTTTRPRSSAHRSLHQIGRRALRDR